MQLNYPTGMDDRWNCVPDFVFRILFREVLIKYFPTNLYHKRAWRDHILSQKPPEHAV